jgi:hypothetical protein
VVGDMAQPTDSTAPQLIACVSRICY